SWWSDTRAHSERTRPPASLRWSEVRPYGRPKSSAGPRRSTRRFVLRPLDEGGEGNARVDTRRHAESGPPGAARVRAGTPAARFGDRTHTDARARAEGSAFVAAVQRSSATARLVLADDRNRPRVGAGRALRSFPM